MIPKDLTRDIKHRLKNVKGQIEGVIKMLDEEYEKPDQILLQFKAVDKAFQKAHLLLLDEVYRKALAIKLVNTVEACPGNCQDAEKITELMKKFPELELDELSKRLLEINEIKKRLDQHNLEETKRKKTEK